MSLETFIDIHEPTAKLVVDTIKMVIDYNTGRGALEVAEGAKAALHAVEEALAQERISAIFAKPNGDRN